MDDNNPYYHDGDWQARDDAVILAIQRNVVIIGNILNLLMMKLRYYGEQGTIRIIELRTTSLLMF